MVTITDLAVLYECANGTIIIKYNKQYHNLKVIFNDTFHDKYFILDDKTIYHCGASINKIGYKTFSITLIGEMIYVNH